MFLSSKEDISHLLMSLKGTAVNGSVLEYLVGQLKGDNTHTRRKLKPHFNNFTATITLLTKKLKQHRLELQGRTKDGRTHCQRESAETV